MTVKQGIPTAILTAKRARAISNGGGMEVLQKKEGSNRIATGI